MGAYDTPTRECPYCKSYMEADWVDVGVGMVQCGPYHCYECGASEIGPELSDWYYKDREGETIYLDGWYPVLKLNHPFSEMELETGYYDPSKNKVSPYANTVNGVLVDHVTAKAAYNLGLLDKKGVN
ncbi:hypothetical protein JC777_00215 (plasmid) [Bacillus cytotoxicus]|uniref:Uncharacterized protein n=1 Tax=Bacillus cytotoxicus TaxID=580165 RepID=A0AAX2CPR5_9BACI|nr:MULTISPECIES: hypothetical protein [Bacillus cereus group]MDH2882466.1 hypothetical protein [Bacillus cytotoxicus]QTR81145.1 hypothetical protein JC777_00215 [Bacillus cytotoxicus]QTR87918.1 hypothetical protein JC774_05200 [Bacillus cytotoxicus]SCM08452.1 Putative uncharacterized protein [Bacillus cytotoxicus]HDR4573328.1 hypothetical protein [Bacillus cytotoxicus]